MKRHVHIHLEDLGVLPVGDRASWAAAFRAYRVSARAVELHQRRGVPLAKFSGYVVFFSDPARDPGARHFSPHASNLATIYGDAGFWLLASKGRRFAELRRQRLQRAAGGGL